MLAFAAPLTAAIASDGHASARGASSLWYLAPPHRAALVQLSIPGHWRCPRPQRGHLARFAFAAAAIVGGIALAVLAKRKC